MNKYLVTSALALSLSCGSRPVAQPLQPLCDAACESPMSVLRKYRDKGEFSGVVAVTRHGRTVMRVAIGDADREQHRPMKLTETFRLASLTKQVTAVLVMQQVEHGALTLDDAIGLHLPHLPSAVRSITVRQLLTHTSGLINADELVPGTDEFAVPGFYVQHGAATSTDALAAQCSARLPGPSGSFAYNNCDYIILGQLLERKSRLPFHQLVDRDIVTPLRLTSWRIATDAAPAQSSVRGYTDKGALEPKINEVTFGAGGALVGQVNDILQWNSGLLSHRLLSKSSTATMFTGDPKLGYEALGSWSYELPIAGEKCAVIERQGSVGGTRLLSLLLPTLDMSIVVVANTERADLFALWSQKGFAFELVASVVQSFAPQIFLPNEPTR